MTAELAEIIPFPSPETGYPEVDAIIDQVRQGATPEMRQMKETIQAAQNDLEAVLAIRSELLSFFPQIAEFPDRADDPEFQEHMMKGQEADKAAIQSAQTLYVARKIVNAVRHF